MDTARKKEEIPRKRKQWRWGEPERDIYKEKKNQERHRESLRGQRGLEKRGNAWWRVRVKEQNPGSQGN